jgi:Helix-turn-helix
LITSQPFPKNVQAGFENVIMQGPGIGQKDFDGYHLRGLGRHVAYRSQEQFSTVLNIDRTAISRIESGNRPINTDLLRK